jgi:hypothetical protein
VRVEKTADGVALIRALQRAGPGFSGAVICVRALAVKPDELR